MSATIKCDGCGKEVPMVWTRSGAPGWHKPRQWYQRQDEDGIQDACCRECIASDDTGPIASNMRRAARARDIDALRDQRDALSAALSDCETALREIIYGKIQSDNEHPLGEAWSMSGRFIEIARSALIRAEKTRGGTL